MSIDPQTLKETDEFIDLQESIINLTTQKIEDTLKTCKNFFDQPDIEKQSLVDSFLHAVMNAVHCRPYNHDNIAKICALIIEHFEDTKLVDYFKEEILSTQIDRLQNYEFIPFLQKCYYHKIFSKDQVISCILRYKILTTHNFNTILSFFCYFAPVIQDVFPQLYQECIDKMDYKEKNSELPIEFHKFHKKFRFFKQMDWELQHVCTYNYYIPGTIEWAIGNDDVNEMKNIIERTEYESYKYIVTPDDYVLDYEQFHPNKRVLPSVFEPSRILLNHPTLIQFAAYHGSANCFKYLLQLGASPNCIDQVGIGLAQFAAAGENLEIIQLCAQLNVNFARSCHFATAYNNFDVLQWMIKNMHLRILNTDDAFGTILHRAAASNNIRILKFCIDYCTENVKKGVRNSCFDLHEQYLKYSKNKDRSSNLSDEKEDSDTDSSCSDTEYDPEFQIINVVTKRGETPLHAAAAKGNIEAMKLLLSHRMILPNAISEDGCTPFYFAVLYNKLEVVNYLITDSRININKPDDEGQTPLHIAVKYGYYDIVASLLSSPHIQINACNMNGQTALHYAAIYDQKDILDVLLDDERTQKNPQDNLKQTPLFVAIMQDNQKIVEELINRKEISITLSDELGYTPLHIAVELHRLECERLLLHKHFDESEMIDNEEMDSHDNELLNDFLKNQKKLIKDLNCSDDNGMNAIQLAVQNGDIESIMLLMDFVNIFHKDNNGNTTIHIAALNDQTELLSYFYEMNSFNFKKKNNLGQSPFQTSIQAKGFETFLFFIRNSKELDCEECIHEADYQGMSALSLATKYQRFEMVEYLLKTVGGFNVNEQNNLGQTPLHIAASLMNHEIFRILLNEENIDINLQDNKKNTPLFVCIANKDEEAALSLIERRDCLTNIQNEDGWTPLHFAASIGNVKLLMKIINKKDAPVDVLNNDQMTPLDIAIQNKFTDAEEYLILKASQKNLEIKDKSGHTAYDYAISTNQKDVAQMINNKINSPITSFFQSIPKMTTLMIKH
ncbi:hypothetical protein M9Y10_041294 [Tritrichomonas musculus]|uniref:DUF3447 domain-containing protein n=1 Tax=Tritrichomonas musculus TaxID=1915356 RepID=A0ABR2K3X7_9EUKA